MNNFCTYLRVLLVFSKIHDVHEGIWRMQKAACIQQDVSTESTRVCEKDLNVIFLVQILYFKWTVEAVWWCLL